MHKNLMNILRSNAQTIEERLVILTRKLEDVKINMVKEKILYYMTENEELSKKVENAKHELTKLEISHGKKQYLPIKNTNVTATSDKDEPDKVKEHSKINKCSKVLSNSEGKNTKNKMPKKELDMSESSIDVRKLDFRIGKIVQVDKHPDADSLYVEKIDLGEDTPRTIVSGLVNHVPIDEMKEKLVMVLCNLKPVKMRGIVSEGMVMCASGAEKVEVLVPPPNAVPGDLVTCEGYPREPEAQLNPKKKIFETCAPDLKTNDDNIACYKGAPLIVTGKGPVKSPTMKGVPVK